MDDRTHDIWTLLSTLPTQSETNGEHMIDGQMENFAPKKDIR